MLISARRRMSVGRGLALLVFLLGLLTFSGWLLGFHLFGILFPSLAPISANAALCFLLLGASDLLSQPGQSWRAQRVGAIMAGMVILIASVTLSQDLLNLNLGIDQFFAAAGEIFPRDVAPGRMSPFSALGLLLIAISALTSNRPGQTFSIGCALGAALIGFLALTGYLYDVSSFYQPVGGIYKVSLPTALALLMSSGASLLLRPPSGFLSAPLDTGPVGVLTRRLLLVAVVAPIVLGGLTSFGQRREWYSVELGWAIFTVVSVALIAATLLWNANYLLRVETAKQRAEREFLESESRFRALLDNSPAVMYVKDLDGRFVLVNRAFEQLFGMPSANLLGKTVHDFFPAQEADGYRANDLAALEAPDGIQAEEAIAAGVQRHFLSFKFPLRDSEGRITALGGISAEITERKQMELALESKNAELMASNRELEQFAYVASHDLQEPLRMVSSYMELLERRYRDQLDQDAKEFIDFAVDGATRMQRLINDLLAYSRVGSRGRELEPVEASDSLAAALTNLQMTIQETGALVDQEELPRVLADPDQLVALFQNLLGNAIKFRGEAPPRVEIRARRDGELAHISIADNGIGIDPKYADRVFVIFQRLHNRSEYAGTGIGLAICKKIVERHGGRIWFDSRLGKGTVFHFTLPLAPAEVQPGAEEDTITERARRLI
ncbi:MAG: PAS domain S-box protein [Anaerolineae bacterium]|nr:MAG: PAS domain S-box protein [Anaerolineae bacterium]